MDETNAHIDAHIYCSRNRKHLENDSICGCFYCMSIYSPSEINTWIRDKGGDTAVCPHCGIDSVIGESSGYPITVEFLQRMHDYWF